MFTLRKRIKSKTFQDAEFRNLNAVNAALEYLLSENKSLYLWTDIGKHSSAFKPVCPIDKFGPEDNKHTYLRVCTGFCLGASQTGSLL